jgi:phosphatidate cytidylyltransferase
MNKIIQRLLIFFLGVPAVLGLIYFLPFFNHLALNIVVTLFCAIGAVEFSLMLEKKNLKISKIEAFILGLLAPLSLTLSICFNIPLWISPVLIMAGASWALLSGVFTRNEKLETVTNRQAGIFSVLVYPGFFMFWLIKMTAWENASIIILTFLFICIGSDSAAWLTGSLFGKNNKGIFPVSPNKSIAGFIGGIIGSIIVSGAAAIVFPDLFIAQIQVPVLCAAIILGVCTGIASELGDLAESAIKRSCGVKDSGKIMLGRGGILDSIDSIAFAAPVFFLLYDMFFVGL